MERVVKVMGCSKMEKWREKWEWSGGKEGSGCWKWVTVALT